MYDKAHRTEVKDPRKKSGTIARSI